jgi:hypothetical protein
MRDPAVQVHVNMHAEQASQEASKASRKASRKAAESRCDAHHEHPARTGPLLMLTQLAQRRLRSTALVALMCLPSIG